jgi:hypothetical protein
VIFNRGGTAKAIESLLAKDCCRVQRTMPADLPPTPGYRAMNSDPLGIAPEKAEQASWRAAEAHRFNVEPGFVLLTTVPPQPTGRPAGIELHALPQTRQFAGRIGWAWCFGIDTDKHRTYLRAVSGTS